MLPAVAQVPFTAPRKPEFEPEKGTEATWSREIAWQSWSLGRRQSAGLCRRPPRIESNLTQASPI
jgi:hypothetical protein